MAIFYCKNCGKYFIKDMKDKPSLMPPCEHCGSYWTVYVGPGLTEEDLKKLKKLTFLEKLFKEE